MDCSPSVVYGYSSIKIWGGGGVIGSHVTGNDKTGSYGSDPVRFRDRFPRFFLTIVVVQVPLLPDVTLPRRGFPLGVPMRNRRMYSA